ncbi:MAG: PAS domain S-box protein, partial [Gemmatimonadota bacterium]
MSTPRKARQQPDVREAEARYRSLFEQVPIGLFRTAPDGRILDANPTLYVMLGCATLEEFLATNAGDYYVNAEDRRRCREMLERDGIVRNFEAEFRTRTGTTLWVALSESAVRDEQGRVRFYEGAMKDITEQKRAQAAVAASEIRLRTIVETEPECVKVMAADGTLLEMNAAGLAMLEADSAEQVVGRNVFDCVAPEHREAFRTLTQRVCRGEEGTLEFEVIGLKGTRRWLETRAAPLRDERGAIVAALAVTRDVTQRKHDERVRLATYRIAEAANTTHSLNDLLATIHRIVGEVMPARNLFVALLDPAGATISFPYFADERDPAPPAPMMKIGDRRTLTEYVLRTGRPLLATREVFDVMVQRGEVTEVGAPSIDWVGVPLEAEDRTIGVLAVQSYSEGVRYGERDVEILRFVSTQVAQAIARKQAEEERGASERRLRTVIESAPIVLWAFDKDGVFTLSEGSGLKALGLRPGQVVGRSVFEVYQDFPGIVADARRALAGEPLTTVAEVGGLAFDVRYTPVRDERGTLSAVVGVGTDITARRASETSLRETLSLLSATLESTADGILVVDREGKVASHNQRFVELWRIPEALLATRDDDRLIGFVLDQLANPDAFVAKIRQLYDDPSAESL